MLAVEMIEEIESKIEEFKSLHYGITARELSQAYPITSAQASQALIWLENKGVLSSRYDSRINSKIYWVK